MARLSWSIAFFCISIFAFSAPGRSEGAIAVGKDGNGTHWFAMASEIQDSSRAKALAMSGCLRKGPGCSIVRRFRNSCAAVVYGETPSGSNGLDIAEGVSETDAIFVAMQKCSARGARCQLRASACDHYDEVQVAEGRRLNTELQVADAIRIVEQLQREARIVEGQRLAAEQDAERARQLAENARQQAAEIIAGARREAGFLRAAIKIAEFPLPLGYALLFSFTIFLGLIRIEAVKSLSFGWRVFIAFAVPTSQVAFLFYFGIKGDVSLMEFTLANGPVLGGGLALKVTYSFT